MATMFQVYRTKEHYTYKLKQQSIHMLNNLEQSVINATLSRY